MTIIEELKAEHVFLANALKEVKEKGISSKEGLEKLMSIKEVLLAHIAKEDKHIYPLLNEKAKNDDTLRSMLGTFDSNMKNVADTALKFFNKYSKAEADPVEFGKDFGFLSWALGIRIRQEESILYSEFEKIQH